MTAHDPPINCFCHFCGCPLRFQISRVGQAVNCFNCSLETVLFIPGLPPPYPEDQYQLEVADIHFRSGRCGVRHVEGTVTNISDKNLDWVRIEFILYNQSGLPIGSTSDCLISFPCRRVWTFKAMLVQPEAVRASDPLLSCEYGRVTKVTLKSFANTASFPSSQAKAL